MLNYILISAFVTAAMTSTSVIAQGVGGSVAIHPAPQSTRMDLTGFFHTRSAWHLTVTEGPPTKDYGNADAPGALKLCLHKGTKGRCVSDPVTLPLNPPTPDYAIAWEPHYLKTAKLVYPQGPAAAPLLLIVTSSLHSGDGDQVVSTQLITYDANKDIFRRVYGESTGHNNNQEIRFIADGPLRGSVISAEPQAHLPYGYWVVVKQATPSGKYQQVLRYASATHYNDGNQLAVIDSEMPTIENRLGLWKSGEPIPIPNHGKPCLKPALRHAELWCGQ